MRILRYLSTANTKTKFQNTKIPTLEEFLFNQKLKTIYKSIIKQIYKKFKPTNNVNDINQRNELIEFLKSEFKLDNNKNRKLSERKYLLSSGLNQIGSMSSSLGLNITI